MESLIKFFEENCVKRSDKDFLLDTGFDKINFIIDDPELDDRRSTQMNNVVRFLNPQVDIYSQLQTHITDVDSFPDFDSAVQVIEEKAHFDEEKYLGHIMKPEVFKLFFLPTNIQNEITKVTSKKETNDIDLKVKDFFLEEHIQQHNLTFIETNKKVRKHKSRQYYAVSFIKFFDEHTKEECSDAEEITKKVNKLKYDLNIRHIQSYDYYFIGNIKEGTTLIERDEHDKKVIPYHFHYNAWKLNDYEIDDAYGQFNIYPFRKKEAV